jgi:hypothetical protein
MNAQFLAIAQDPAIIPGVHHHCDEWCEYCPVTRRCLAFRCMTEFRRQRGRFDARMPFATTDEAVAFTRELAAVEGMRTDELDALMAAPADESGAQASDPLLAMAWEYAVGAALFIVHGAHTMPRLRPGGTAPEPIDVVLWYHLRIYMAMFRGLVGCTGDDARPDRIERATGCAKLVLLSVQRSWAALDSLRAGDNEPGIRALMALLERLERGVDERFPAARSFVRVGLDCPVS